MAVIELAWDEVYNLRLAAFPNTKEMKVGAREITIEDTLDFGEPIGVVNTRELHRVAMWYTLGKCEPQLAALVFMVTHNPIALNPYFPLTRTLDKAKLKEFCQFIQQIIRSSNFDFHVFGAVRAGLLAGRADITKAVPAHLVYLVAGHIAEVFFYRRDILERLLSSKRSFFLYTSPLAFTRDGGQAGGNYDSARGAIQLVLPRLYEGFYGKTPGVAPFLHEFGHMLDHLDASTGKLGKSHGLLPGMRPEDGDIYTPEAREAFLRGKHIELERYLKLYEQGYRDGDPLPIGHPYVFQNDGEFIAGYLEMFFRNPHYFAVQNPDLYDGFSKLFKQDPHLAWDEDFPFYVNENRSFYLRGARPPQPGITV